MDDYEKSMRNNVKDFGHEVEDFKTRLQAEVKLFENNAAQIREDVRGIGSGQHDARTHSMSLLQGRLKVNGSEDD